MQHNWDMSEDAREAICRRVRDAFKERDAAGVSAREIAELSGLPYTAVRKYAARKNQTLPRPENWGALAKALEKPEEWFLHGTMPAYLDGDGGAPDATDRQAVLSLLSTAVAALGDAVLHLASGEHVAPSVSRKLEQVLGQLSEADRAAAARP